MEPSDHRSAIRDFLATRRAKLTPHDVGLPPAGGRRRVPGLRREEVAVLAGVSTEWYARLEKGHINGVSDDVLDAVARALRLDEAERLHLFNLARAARPKSAARRPRASPVRPSIERLLDSMLSTPAFVRNARNDVMACNPLFRALYAPVFDDPVEPPNIVRFTFLDPRRHDFYPDWDEAADGMVALLRHEAGLNPYDRDLTDLVGELVTRSDEFRTRWAGHDVRMHLTGTKRIINPIVGLIEITYDVLDLPADPGLTLTTYGAEPSTPAADALALLANWAATQHEETNRPPASSRPHALESKGSPEGPATL
ncbi:helix-turn-helix transcriptional regulator [Galactobacter caseinivorans]|uniref:XRE family transcriptional regulator n=1 Tax=Galactobacter caseinivorans TaxID=2676123 RepID=A0A496PLM7_9MICC|nr:helix-turn-helix transcriptional regulator [Galactobacter caseinivorans]RKW71438.1 XRE family transcriptional regulator [Galactobacter caseinivorans]